MSKMSIEGTEISYRTVVELQANVKTALAQMRTRRENMESQLKEVRKKEAALERFLGVEEAPNPV